MLLYVGIFKTRNLFYIDKLCISEDKNNCMVTLDCLSEAQAFSYYNYVHRSIRCGITEAKIEDLQ